MAETNTMKYLQNQVSITQFGYFLKSVFLSRLSISVFVIIATGLLFLINSDFLRSNLKDYLSGKLIAKVSIMPGDVVDVVYILGGSQEGLKFKFKTVADLYHKGNCKKIWFLSQSGITEYSPSLGRNLTNDEWSILKLKEFGVSKEHIEPIGLKEGFFGTYSEAKGISSLVKKRRYKSILLVSAPYHTQRVKISFDNFLKNQNTSLLIQGSERKAFLRDLIVEYFKLKVYQYFLI